MPDVGDTVRLSTAAPPIQWYPGHIAKAEKALSAGCDVYMSKPINIRELWARVEAFVPSPQKPS